MALAHVSSAATEKSAGNGKDLITVMEVAVKAAR
jgi:hypothetical protein